MAKNRRIFGIVGMTMAAALGCGAGSVALAAPQSIQLENITQPLVPSRVVGGDREFGGNGPDIQVRTTLEIGDAGSKLYANVWFNAKETKPDWSETDETFRVPVYTAPAGMRITRILDAPSSSVSFRSQPAGMQILAPASDWAQVVEWVAEVVEMILAQTGNEIEIPEELPCDTVDACADALKAGILRLEQDNLVEVRAPEAGPVAAFMVVGDTGGPDISDDKNPKDDTRIAGIAFKEVQVDLQIARPIVATSTTVRSLGSMDRNVDRTGSDYRSFALRWPDAALCQQACNAEGQCQAWAAWTPTTAGQSGHCWLKNGVPAPRPLAGITSGTIAGSGAASIRLPISFQQR